MTDEEINQKFDVVADLMASLAVKLDGLTDRTGELAEAQQRAEQRWERTEGSIRGLLTVAEIQAQEIKDLGAAVRAVDTRGRETDERLSALINTVERLISEGRNGR